MLDNIESLLDRVKVLYEQYFLGIQKQAPAHLHHDLDRKLRDLSQINLRNTAMRYRLATVQQKFGSYNTYWRRTLRQIENGTYARSLSRIGRQAARTGEEIPEEILAAMPKRMREQVARDRVAAIAQQRRQRAGAGGVGVVDAAGSGGLEVTTDTGDDFDLDIEEAALDDVATIHSKPPPGVVHQLPDEDDVDVDALFAAITDAGDGDDAGVGKRSGGDAERTRQAPKRASTDVGIGAGVAGRPAPAGPPGRPQELRPQSGQSGPGGQNPAGASRVPGGPSAVGGGPSTQPLHVARPAPERVAPAPSAPHAPAAPAAPAGQAVLGRIAVGPPGAGARPPGAAAPGPRTQQMHAARPTPQVPATPSEPSAGSPPGPGPSTQPMHAARPTAPRVVPPAAAPAPGPRTQPLPAAQPPAPTPGPSTQPMPAAPPPPPQRAAPPGALKTPPGSPVAAPPAPQRMTPRAVPAAPAPGASMPRVRPPSGVPPIGSFAPRSADPRDPVAPPAAKPVAKPVAGPSRPPPIPSIPRPPIPSIPSPAARPTGEAAPRPPAPAPAPAPARPAAAPARPLPAGVSQAEVTALYSEYVKARSSVGEQSDARTYDRLVRTIEQQAPKIMEEHHAKGVEFHVVVKDNQVVLRAKPKP